MFKYSLTPIITTNSKYFSYFDILSQPHSNITQVRDYIEQPIKRIINTTKYEILWDNININTFLLLFNQNMVDAILNNNNQTLSNYNYKYVSTKEQFIDLLSTLSPYKQQLITILSFFKYKLFYDKKYSDPDNTYKIYNDITFARNTIIPLKYISEVLQITLLPDSELQSIMSQHNINQFVNTQIITSSNNPITDIIDYVHHQLTQDTLTQDIRIVEFINELSNINFHLYLVKEQINSNIQSQLRNTTSIDLTNTITNQFVLQLIKLYLFTQQQHLYNAIFTLIDEINIKIPKLRNKLTFDHLQFDKIIQQTSGGVLDPTIINQYYNTFQSMIVTYSENNINYETQKFYSVTIYTMFQQLYQLNNTIDTLTTTEVTNSDIQNIVTNIFNNITLLNFLTENEINYNILTYVIPQHFLHESYFNMYIFTKLLITTYLKIFLQSNTISNIFVSDYFGLMNITIPNLFDTTESYMYNNNFLYNVYTKKYLMQYFLIGDKYFFDITNVIDQEYFLKPQSQNFKSYLVNVLAHVQQTTELKKIYLFTPEIGLLSEETLKHKIQNYMVDIKIIDEKLFNDQFKKYIIFISTKLQDFRTSQLVRKVLYTMKKIQSDTTQTYSMSHVLLTSQQLDNSKFYNPRTKYTDNIITQDDNILQKNLSPITLYNILKQDVQNKQLPLVYSVYSNKLNQNVITIKSKIFVGIDIDKVLKHSVQSFSEYGMVNEVLENILILVKHLYFIVPYYVSIVIEQIITGSQLTDKLVTLEVPYTKIYKKYHQNSKTVNITNIIHPFEISQDFTILIQLLTDQSYKNIDILDGIKIINSLHPESRWQIFTFPTFIYLIDSQIQNLLVRPYLYNFITQHPIYSELIDTQVTSDNIKHAMVNTSESLQNDRLIFVPVNGLSEVVYGYDSNSTEPHKSFIQLRNLFISSSTIKRYIHYIKGKLELNNFNDSVTNQLINTFKTFKKYYTTYVHGINYVTTVSHEIVDKIRKQYEFSDCLTKTDIQNGLHKQHDIIQDLPVYHYRNVQNNIILFNHHNTSNSINGFYVENSETTYNNSTQIHKLVELYNYLNNNVDEQYLDNNQYRETLYLMQLKVLDNNQTPDDLTNDNYIRKIFFGNELDPNNIPPTKQQILTNIKYIIINRLLQFGNTYKKNLTNLSYENRNTNIPELIYHPFSTDKHLTLSENFTTSVDSYIVPQNSDVVNKKNIYQSFMNLYNYYIYRLFEDVYINSKSIPTSISLYPTIQQILLNSNLQNGYNETNVCRYSKWRFNTLDKLTHPVQFNGDSINEPNISQMPVQTIQTKLQPVTQRYLLCQPVVRDIIESFELFGGDLNLYSDTFLTSQQYETKPKYVISNYEIVISIDTDSDITTSEFDDLNTLQSQFGIPLSSDNGLPPDVGLV